MKHGNAYVATAMVCSTVAVVGALLGRTGPLDPPAGPVGPTFKTLQEIEPRIPVGPDTTPGDADSLFKITYPDSYYLTGDVVGVAGKHGVEIAVSNVQLDLNGFSVIGPGGTGGFSGVHVSAAQTRRVSVRNGRVGGWSGSGLDLQQASSATVRDVQAYDNAVHGVRVGDESVVDRCMAFDNGDVGVFTGDGCVVTNTMAFGPNEQSPLPNNDPELGVRTGSGSRVEACSVTGNLNGVSAGDGSQILHSAAFGNGVVDFSGFFVLGEGFNVGAGGTVRESLAANNASTGIRVGQGGLVEHSYARGTEGGNNFDLATAATARGNLSASAQEDPFLDFNGFGVFAQQGASVDGNHFLDNVRSVFADASGVLVIRNSSKITSSIFPNGPKIDYSLVAGGKVGPIVVPPDSAAVLGVSGGAGVGTTDPFANFSF